MREDERYPATLATFFIAQDADDDAADLAGKKSINALPCVMKLLPCDGIFKSFNSSTPDEFRSAG